MLRHRQLGSTVRGLLPQRYGLTLILEQDTCLGAPLAVVYDGSQMADRALLAAIDINNHREETPALLVLLLAPDQARNWGETRYRIFKIVSKQHTITRQLLAKTKACL